MSKTFSHRKRMKLNYNISNQLYISFQKKLKVKKKVISIFLKTPTLKSFISINIFHILLLFRKFFSINSKLCKFYCSHSIQIKTFILGYCPLKNTSLWETYRKQVWDHNWWIITTYRIKTANISFEEQATPSLMHVNHPHFYLSPISICTGSLSTTEAVEKLRKQESSSAKPQCDCFQNPLLTAN